MIPTYGSFNELVAGQNQGPSVSDMSVFNAVNIDFMSKLEKMREAHVALGEAYKPFLELQDQSDIYVDVEPGSKTEYIGTFDAVKPEYKEAVKALDAADKAYWDAAGEVFRSKSYVKNPQDFADTLQEFSPQIHSTPVMQANVYVLDNTIKFRSEVSTDDFGSHLKACLENGLKKVPGAQRAFS